MPNIIKPTYEILLDKSPKEMYKRIEEIGRTCYKSEDKVTEESHVKFVGDLIKRGHEAMIEHESITVCFTVDRGVTHELVRHRIASFAQESTRYCNYNNDKFGNEISVVDITEAIKMDPKMKKLDADTIFEIIEEWSSAMSDAEAHYLKMIELGATPQIARSVLPNSTKATIWITANIREWRSIFKLRADKPAHPQMREVMVPLLSDLKDILPVFFGDIDSENTWLEM